LTAHAGTPLPIDLQADEEERFKTLDQIRSGFSDFQITLMLLPMNLIIFRVVDDELDRYCPDDKIQPTRFPQTAPIDEAVPRQCPPGGAWVLEKGDDGSSGSETVHDVPRFTSPRWRIATSC
jgi:hypothetical protein